MRGICDGTRHLLRGEAHLLRGEASVTGRGYGTKLRDEATGRGICYRVKHLLQGEAYVAVRGMCDGERYFRRCETQLWQHGEPTRTRKAHKSHLLDIDRVICTTAFQTSPLS